MKFLSENGKGILVCLALAIPASLLGKLFPIIGGPVFAIIGGMLFAPLIRGKDSWQSGIKYTSKKILQYAVVLLGFGMNLEVVMETGKQSLPVIICTITTSLVIAWVFYRKSGMDENTATLVGDAHLSAEVLPLRQQRRLLRQMRKTLHRRFQLFFFLIYWQHFFSGSWYRPWILYYIRRYVWTFCRNCSK